MNEKSKKIKVMSGALVGLMMLSVGSISYAASTNNSIGSFSSMHKQQMVQKFGKSDQKTDFKSKLAELVTAGTITQEQSDKILAYMETEQAARKAEQEKIARMTNDEKKAYFEANKLERKDMFSSLVSDGTLTQDQADAVKKAFMPEGRGSFEGKSDKVNFNGQKLTAEEMQAKMDEQVAKQKAELTTALTTAVENGSITQEKSDELTAYLEKKDAERKAEMENRKNMKPSDFKRDSNAVKSSTDATQKIEKMNGPFESAVTDGIITEEQAQAICDIMRASKEAEQKQATEAALANLVAAGTITQEQSDKITSTLEQEKADRIAENEKIAAMSDTERKAYFEQNKPERVMPLASLVDDGTLTQEQADSVMKSIMPNMGMRGFGERPGMGHHGVGPASNDSSLTNTVIE